MNDDIVVSCYLTVSGTYSINSDVFIVGSSDNGLTESEVDGTGSYGGVDLSRLTATISSGSYSVQASITLSSYVQSDNGLRLGCSFTVTGDVNTKSINLQQAGNLFP